MAADVRSRGVVHGVRIAGVLLRPTRRAMRLRAGLTVAALMLAAAVPAVGASAEQPSSEVLIVLAMPLLPGGDAHERLFEAARARLDGAAVSTTVRLVGTGGAAGSAAGTLLDYRVARRPAVAAAQRLTLQQTLVEWSHEVGRRPQWAVTGADVAAALDHAVRSRTGEVDVLLVAPLHRLPAPEPGTLGTRRRAELDVVFLETGVAPPYPAPGTQAEDGADGEPPPSGVERLARWRQRLRAAGIGWSASVPRARYDASNAGGGDPGRAK